MPSFVNVPAVRNRRQGGLIQPSLVRRVGLMSPRFEVLVRNRLERDMATGGAVLAMPGLCGHGRVPSARRRAVALHSVNHPTFLRDRLSLGKEEANDIG